MRVLLVDTTAALHAEGPARPSALSRAVAAIGARPTHTTAASPAPVGDAELVVVHGANDDPRVALEAIARLRDETRGRAPILLCVADLDDAQLCAALAAGADDAFDAALGPAVIESRLRARLRTRAACRDLERRVEELDRLRRLDGDLLRGLAHDLKNPLGVVQANVDYARSQLPGDNEADEALADAEMGARQALGLVEDLAALGREDEARLGVNLRALPPKSFLEDVRRRCQPIATERRVALEVSCGPLDPIVADARLLAHGLERLVEHALRAATAGSRVQMIAQQSARGVVFTVVRNGRPLDAEEREHLFDRYARVASPTRHGPGLGPWFGRRAAEAHEGRLTYVEEDGAQRFVMEIPPLEPPSTSRGSHAVHG